jgi:hypothetical protein
MTIERESSIWEPGFGRYERTFRGSCLQRNYFQMTRLEVLITYRNEAYHTGLALCDSWGSVDATTKVKYLLVPDDPWGMSFTRSFALPLRVA